MMRRDRQVVLRRFQDAHRGRTSPKAPRYRKIPFDVEGTTASVVRRRVPSTMLAAFGVAAMLRLGGCAQPECASVDYRRAECRVIVENELARLRHPGGFELRFQAPDAADVSTWDARGLLELSEPEVVRARVAGPGGFALSVSPSGQDARFELILDNVDPHAQVTVEVGELETEIPPPTTAGLRRRHTMSLDAGASAPIWVRGDVPCPGTMRIAVTADIQTNPSQFERIIERLQLESEASQTQGEPLRGLVVVGDLTESSRDDEFERIDAILQRSPVPVAVTAGNHDVFRTLRPHYNARFGPGNHVVEVCDARIVLLDSGSGAIARSVEARLPELLDRGSARHLLVAVHHPPYAGNTGAGWSKEDRAARLLLDATIAGVDMVLSGHSHSLRHFHRVRVGGGRIEQIIVGTGGAFQGAVDLPRFGYLRLTLSPEGIDRCFVEVPPPGVHRTGNDPLSARLPNCDDE